MSYQLQITPSVGKRYQYALEKSLIKIGRAVHCDVVLNDQLVSREHCQLQLKSDGPFLEDLNSFNGTFVNEQRISRTTLNPGDKIRLGFSEIILEEVRVEEKASAPVPAPEPPVAPKIPVKETKMEAPAKVEPAPPAKPEPAPPAKPEPAAPVQADPAPLTAPAVSEKEVSKPVIEKQEIKEPETNLSKKSQPEPIPLVSQSQEPPTILVIHPDFSKMESLLNSLTASGATILRASGVGQVQSCLKTNCPDSVLLYSDMEGVQDICMEIKSNPEAGPVVLLLAKGSSDKAIPLIKAGVDEILRNPEATELQVRLRNMLELHRLRKEASQLTSQMEKRVNEDVSEAERITRLKRYLSPQVVAAVLSGEESNVLKPTRQEVSIVFSDLRNYTSFSETSEPEEIINMLSDFHALYGEIIFKFDGTLERFAGDGVMVFFGAPVPFKDHARRAVAMAVAARERLVDLKTKWHKLGYTLDISFGISTGYVFVGNIGFESRMDYAAIGKTTNLAARLCAAAKGGEILVSRKTLFQVEDMVDVEEIGALEVKGFSQKVMAYNVLSMKTPFVPTPVG
jgi:adenylate cyclase